MAYLNKVMLIGNMTRDPELRYLQTGTAVCDFGIAVNRSFKTQGGEQKDEVLFVDVTAFGKQAETISEYLQKGRSIFVEGRLKLDQWTGQDGQKRSRMNVVLERFQFMDSRQGGGGQGGGERRAAPQSRPQQTPGQKPQAPSPQSAPQPPRPAQDAPPAGNDFDSTEESIPF